MSTTLKQAIDRFLLSCKVEGKSYGAIECHRNWHESNGFLPILSVIDLDPFFEVGPQ